MSINKVPHIFIYMHYLNIGGAESALVSLLERLTPDKVTVDLFLASHEGPLLSRIPPYINLLPENPVWAHIEKPILKTLFAGYFRLAFKRIKARLRFQNYRKRNPLPEGKNTDETLFSFIGKEISPVLPEISPDKEYDFAVSFMMPHDYIADKVRAKRYAAWLHTDYSVTAFHPELFPAALDRYDDVVAVSAECAAVAAGVMPAVSAKIKVVENIVGVREKKCERNFGDKIKILSLGRFCKQKNFTVIPEIAAELRRRNIDFEWIVAGPGDNSDVNAAVIQHGVADCVLLHPSVANTESLFADTDIYVQPSVVEGKAVAVEEAKGWGIPVVITPYPTSSSQVDNGVTGLIAKGFSPSEVADEIVRLLADADLRQNISSCGRDEVRRNSDFSESSFMNLVSRSISSTEKIPRKIHYCWFGGKPLPAAVEKLMDTWKRPGWEIVRWDETNFPIERYPYAAGAYEAGNYAFVSDVCRIYALLNYGGVYLDTDVSVVGPLEKYLDNDSFMGYEGTKFVGTAVIGAVAGHPFIAELDNIYRNMRYTHDATTNVRLITGMLASGGLRLDGTEQTVAGVTVYPYEIFSPFDYIDGRLRKTGKTVTIHWYSQYWLSSNPPLRRKMSVLLHRICGRKME